jgi:prevent-host-death family protein
MAKLRVSEDIIPISEFKAQAAEWLRRIAVSHQPLVITQNGKAAGVVLSPAAFDELSERQQLIEAVQEGMADEQAGDTYSTEEVFEAAGRRIAAIKAK